MRHPQPGQTRNCSLPCLMITGIVMRSDVSAVGRPIQSHFFARDGIMSSAMDLFTARILIAVGPIQGHTQLQQRPTSETTMQPAAAAAGRVHKAHTMRNRNASWRSPPSHSAAAFRWHMTHVVHATMQGASWDNRGSHSARSILPPWSG